MRIAILDDYQNVATSFADWDSLDADVVVFTKPFTDADDVVRSLAGFDVLVAMRERTQFPAEVLEKLTDIRLLVSTGPANAAAIDLSAAGRRGITVPHQRPRSKQLLWQEGSFPAKMASPMDTKVTLGQEF
jgi:phosphoglycerate dehydrogenase-like enzyme